MNRGTEARIKRLEQVNDKQMITWRIFDLYQSDDDPELWSTTLDGSDLTTVAEHEAQLEGDHWIIVRHAGVGATYA